jgi:hypothetical protein
VTLNPTEVAAGLRGLADLVANGLPVDPNSTYVSLSSGFYSSTLADRTPVLTALQRAARTLDDAGIAFTTRVLRDSVMGHVVELVADLPGAVHVVFKARAADVCEPTERRELAYEVPDTLLPAGRVEQDDALPDAA